MLYIFYKYVDLLKQLTVIYIYISKSTKMSSNRNTVPFQLYFQPPTIENRE